MITLEKILATALHEPGVMDSLGEALRSDLVVANPYYRQIATFADEFYGEYRKLPRSGDWDIWISSLPEVQRSGIRDSLGRLQMQTVDNAEPQHFGDRIIEELQKVAAATALARLNSLQEGSITPEAFQTLAEKIQAVRSSSLEGLAALRDVEIWADPHYEETRILTGYPSLNKLIGGWQEELVMVFADSGVGKSMFLQNVGANLAAQGKRVLHITLELGLRPLIQRYYRQIAQAQRKEFVVQADAMKSKLRHWFQYAKGEIFILEAPAYSMDPRLLQRAVEKLSRSLGDIEALIIDYLDLMVLPKGEKGRSSYEDLGKLTHLVRGLCSQFEIPIFTASQAVRKPTDANRLAMSDLGDSYQKVRGVDILLSLQQTQEEEETHQGRLGLLKVRDSGGRGKEVPLYMNKELALYQDLHHPNTVELMKTLGHQPVIPSYTPGGRKKK